MRWNMVGTMLDEVIRYRAMRSSVPSGVHLSMITTGTPMCSTAGPIMLGVA